MALWRPFEVEDNNITPENPEIVEPVIVENVETNLEFRNKDLHLQSQRIILNIHERLKSENPEQCEKEIIRRINELTKISQTTIYRVIQKGDVIDHSAKRKGKNVKLKNIDDSTRDVLRRTIYNMYKENIVPTLKMIQEKLSDFPDYNYRSLDTLRNVLLECGFKHKKLDSRMVIMESRRIVALRVEYLEKIKEYRQLNRQIVYLDETWFDTHDVVQYGWVDSSHNCVLNTPCSRGKRVIILHAGSVNGFVPNALLLSAKNISQSSADYHEDMTADLFEKWFSEQLLPNISPNSVIVLDNASYHSRILNKIPNISTKKEDILKFMRNKNMEIPVKIPIKRELLKSIKEQNFKNEYVIDNLANIHGHTLLRLPPYYCIFNPIEMVWAAIKKRLRKCNNSPTLSAIVVDHIRQVVNDIDNTDLWKNCVRHVIEKENEYPTLSPIAPIIIQLNNDSSSESEDSGTDIFPVENI